MTAKYSIRFSAAGLLLVLLFASIHLGISTSALGNDDVSQPEALAANIKPAPAAKTPDAKTPAAKIPDAAESGVDNDAYDGPPLLPIPAVELGEPESLGEYNDQTLAQGEDCPTDLSCYDAVCGPAGGFWARGDYLIWWTKGSRLPPLVTTSVADTPRSEAGVLGETGTSVLFGNSTVSRFAKSGYRLTLGYWTDCCNTRGVEADYFDAGTSRKNFFANSTGSPIIARPFYNVVNEQQDAELTAYPDVVAGHVSAQVTSHFQSTGIRLRRNLTSCTWCDYRGCEDYCGEDVGCEQPSCAACGTNDWGTARSYRLDLIGGYRYYRLNDRLSMNEDLVVTDSHGSLVTGTIFNLFDSFHTTNDFHGGEVGLVANFYRGCWSLELLGKLGIGNNRQTVYIDGSTAVTVPGQTTLYYTGEGGLLALPTNIGTHSRDRFVVIPQFGIEVGYQLSCNVRAYAGYNFIYWSNVVRAGDQVDLRIDPNNLPPAAPSTQPFPAVLMAQSSFWAQGINLGLELRY